MQQALVNLQGKISNSRTPIGVRAFLPILLFKTYQILLQGIKLNTFKMFKKVCLPSYNTQHGKDKYFSHEKKYLPLF